MPTSASDLRHGELSPPARRPSVRAHTTRAGNGSPTSIMSSTPFSVSKQPCHRPAVHAGADIMSGRRTVNIAPARPRITRQPSVILRRWRGGADGFRPLGWRIRPRNTELSGGLATRPSTGRSPGDGLRLPPDHLLQWHAVAVAEDDADPSRVRVDVPVGADTGVAAGALVHPLAVDDGDRNPVRAETPRTVGDLGGGEHVGPGPVQHRAVAQRAREPDQIRSGGEATVAGGIDEGAARILAEYVRVRAALVQIADGVHHAAVGQLHVRVRDVLIGEPLRPGVERRAGHAAAPEDVLLHVVPVRLAGHRLYDQRGNSDLRL